jgi:hypothetical protein
MEKPRLDDFGDSLPPDTRFLVIAEPTVLLTPGSLIAWVPCCDIERSGLYLACLLPGDPGTGHSAQRGADGCAHIAAAQSSGAAPPMRTSAKASPRALEFLILTAARTGEVIGAPPSETKDKVWTCPLDP